MNLIHVETDEYNPILREIFSEYLEWVLSMCEKEFDVSYNIRELVKEAVERSIKGIKEYLPPEGCLILCKDETQIIGTASMRKIGDNIGEIKRMYVHPLYRGKGIGRALLERLIKEA